MAEFYYVYIFNNNKYLFNYIRSIMKKGCQNYGLGYVKSYIGGSVKF